MDQNIMMQASMLQQQSKELEENLSFIEDQLSELTNFQESLSSLEKSSEKSLLSSLGRGVYAKTSLEDKKLFVEVGSGVLVKKTPEEAIQTIQSQLEQLTQAKTQIQSQLEICTHQLGHMIQEIQKEQEQA